MNNASSEPEISVWKLEPEVRLSESIEAPHVTVSIEVMNQLQAQTEAELHCEVGGLLFGSVRVNGTEMNIEVHGSLPAEAFRAGPAHFVFTHESWQRLRERRQAEYPDSLVVGWYHTHPGMGLFLSGADRALHERIFCDNPWCVALVIDPVSHTSAFFWPARGKVVRCNESVNSGAQA